MSPAATADAFAQTMAAPPSYRIPPPYSGQRSASERARSPSFVDRLRAPTPFRRKPWLAAWIGLGSAGALMLLWLALSGRHPRAAAGDAPSASASAATATLDAPAAPDSPALAPPAEAPRPLPTPRTPRLSFDESTDKPRPPRGFCYLLVHSAAPYASVYVQLARYGRVEGMLTVPCGKRWVSIGVPTRKGREPVWLAPGEMAIVPCGGLLELTMDPKKVHERSGGH